MQITLESSIAHYRIHAYEHGNITVAIPKQREAVAEDHQDADKKLPMWRDTLEHSFVISPELLIRRWGADDFAELHSEHFAELEQYQPEIVLLGTGKTLRRPPASMLAPLINAGIGVEVMDTGAACRTYNILMSDERRVLAALMMI
jgi:uncharacterized protein